MTLATGGMIGVQVSKGQQDADYLAEVPLIALMFLVMVWHGRRRLAATQERLTAVEELHRVSQETLRACCSGSTSSSWTPRTSWAPRSRSRSATPNSSSRRSPTRAWPRTPGWLPANWPGCAA